MTAPFTYPLVPHQRRHGPRGYRDYESYRPWLRDEFAFRCVYCLLRESWGSLKGLSALDHFAPTASRPDLALDYDNLLYGCISCNLCKAKLSTPDPLSALLDKDVRVSDDGEIHAATSDAGRLIDLLALNRPRLREFRELWIRIVRLAARHDAGLHRQLMGYPLDMPDLSTRRPPGGNIRPEGIAQSHLARFRRNELSETY
jgi:hypothetical protein